MTPANKRTRGTVRERTGKTGPLFYFRVRLENDERPEVRLVAPSTPQEAETIADWIVSLVDQLEAAGRVDLAAKTVKQAADARAPKSRDLISQAVRRFCDGGHARPSTMITFEKFAERWTSGELSKVWPDHVATKDWKDDISRLKKYVNPLVGSIPITAFRLEDAERVMRELPAMSASNRRHVAQLLCRVMNLAVWPARLITASPIPRGFLPKKGSPKAMAFLYPDEDAKLLGHQSAPEDERLAFGILDREGMRLDELLSSEWWQWDLTRGVFTLDENKTDDPRLWPLRADVVRAMTIWKHRFEKKLARPFAAVDPNHLPDRMREYLREAGVAREELFMHSDIRQQIRCHDLRATFVTLSLAAGKPESFIKQRTGHKSGDMLARYTRQARTVEELKLGELGNLVDCLGWGIDWGTLLDGPPPEEDATSEECTGRDSNPHALRRRNLNTQAGPEGAGDSEISAGAEEPPAPSVPQIPRRSPSALPPTLGDSALGLASLRAVDDHLESWIFNALLEGAEP